jgi:hypothetical protein
MASYNNLVLNHIIISTLRSGDSTARIWSIPEGRCKPGSQSVPLDALVLKHVRGKTNEKSKDVTTLDWNVSSITYSYLYQDTYICMIESKASILLNVTKIM